MTGNPFIDRFDGHVDLESIERRVSSPAKRIAGLSDTDIEDACTRLSDGLEEVFVATKQCNEVLLKFLRMARAHSIARYEASVVAGYFAKKTQASSSEIICFTGHAGSGKTKLLRALARAAPPDSVVQLHPDYPAHPLRAVCNLSMETNKSLGPLYEQVLGTEEPPAKGTRIPKLQKAAWKRAFLEGLSFNTADETQFVTLSNSATTLLAKILLGLREVGVPLASAMNFSHVHKILKRPKQEKERLVGNFLVLVPDPPDSECWIDTVHEAFQIAPDVYALEARLVASEIHRYCAGLKRTLAKLLIQAYRCARHEGLNIVTIQHIRQAYACHEFSIYREDVEDIDQIAIVGAGYGRDDLQCPFEMPKSVVSQQKTMAETHRGARVAEAALLSAMSPAERKDSDKTSGKPKATRAPMSSNVSKLPLDHSKSKNALLDNFTRFGDGLRKTDRRGRQ